MRNHSGMDLASTLTVELRRGSGGVEDFAAGEERALRAEADGRHGDALGLWRRLHEKYPRRLVADFGIVRCLLALGEEENAFDLALRLADSRPDTVAPLRSVGRTASRLEKHAEAADAWRKVVQAQPDDVWAEVELARALAHAGDPEGAVAIVDRAMSDRPDDTRVLCAAIDGLCGAKHFSSVHFLLERWSAPVLLEVKVFRSASGAMMNAQEFKLAAAVAQQGLGSFPGDARLQQILSITAEKQGDLVEAIRWQELLLGAPQADNDATMALERYAWLLVRAGRLEDLLSYLDRADLGAGESEKLVLARTTALSQLGRFEAVRAAIESHCARHGLGSVPLVAQRLRAMIMTGDYAEAAAFAEGLPSQYRDDQRVLAPLAQIASASGDWEGALALWQKVCRGDAFNWHHLSPLVNAAIRTNALHQIKDTVAMAVERADEACSSGLRGLSQYFLAQRDYDRARVFGRRSVEKDPQNGWSIANLGEVERVSGHSGTAAEWFRKLGDFDDPGLAARALSGALQCGDFELLEKAYGTYMGAVENGTLGASHQLAPSTLTKAHVVMGEFHRVNEADPFAEVFGTGTEFGAGGERAVIIDPGFSRLDGHHLNYNKFLSRFLADRGMTPKVYTWEELGAVDDSGGVELCQHFHFQPYRYDDIISHPMAARNVNLYFAEEAARTPLAQTVEVVAVHSLRMSFALGFARWIASCRADPMCAPRQVVIGIVEADCASPDHPHHAAARSIYGEAMETLSQIEGLDVIVYCETERVKAFITEVAPTDFSIEVYPFLAAGLLRDHAAGTAAEPESPLRVGFVGGTRAARGAGLVPSLVLGTADWQEPVEWHVQMDFDILREILTPEEWAGTKDFMHTGHCRLYPSSLSTEAYANLLGSVDVIVMPYDARYMVSGSGVFFEALALGKLPLVPRQTLLSGTLDELGYPDHHFEAVEPEAILRQIRVLAREPDTVRRMAFEKGADWWNTKSPVAGFSRRFDGPYRADL